GVADKDGGVTDYLAPSPVQQPGQAPLSMVLQNFNGPAVPLDGDGDTYPNELYYPANPSNPEGGHATVSLDSSAAVSGNSLLLHLTDGKLYAQFNPWNYANNPAYPSERGFARDYSQNPAA